MDIFYSHLSSQRQVLIQAFVGAVLWSIWKERNSRTFSDSSRNVAALREDILALTGFWASSSDLFCNYEASLISLNWEVFM